MTYKRVTELDCASCGAQIEIVFGAWGYYLLWWTSQVGWQVAFVAIICLAFTRQWLWLAAVIGVSIGFEWLRALVLRRGATVRWINERSMERRAAGQWVPE